MQCYGAPLFAGAFFVTFFAGAFFAAFFAGAFFAAFFAAAFFAGAFFACHPLVIHSSCIDHFRIACARLKYFLSASLAPRSRGTPTKKRAAHSPSVAFSFPAIK